MIRLHALRQFRLLPLALVVASLSCTSLLHARQGDDNPAETPAQRQTRMQWWNDARFGIFIHWGAYSHAEGYWNEKPVNGWSEWMMLRGKIPVADYVKIAEGFNPTEFNAEEWARLFKKAGAKYIVFTAKHHDGFAMYPTEASPYSITALTPFKRDPIEELSQACQKEGIKLGLYYSQAQDWLNKGAAEGGHWDPAQDGDMDEYLQKVAIPQIRELLTRYGSIVEWWWDAPIDMTRARADLLAPIPKSIQPNIITNSRVGAGHTGDIEVWEGRLPAGKPEADWETCLTMNGSWGHKRGLDNYPSSNTFIRHLVNAASKGGNLLLNVSPDGKGVIPAKQAEILTDIGEWLAANGEAIYGSKASPFVRPFAWGKITQKPGKAYLHIFNWPGDNTLVLPVRNKVMKACLLGSPGDSLKFELMADKGVQIHLPESGGGLNPADSPVKVVALDIEGELSPLPPEPVAQKDDGSLVLLAHDSEFVNRTEAAWEGEDKHISISNWKNPAESVVWTARFKKPGKYKVVVNYGSERAEGGQFQVAMGEQTLIAPVTNTGGRLNFRDEEIGILDVREAAVAKIAIQLLSMPGRWSVYSVTLLPVP